MSTISGTAGNTSFSWKKYWLETELFIRCAWPGNDVVRLKTVVGRKGLRSFCKHSRMPITRVTKRLVSGLEIFNLISSLPMRLIRGYAAATEKNDANEDGSIRQDHEC